MSPLAAVPWRAVLSGVVGIALASGGWLVSRWSLFDKGGATCHGAAIVCFGVYDASQPTSRLWLGAGFALALVGLTLRVTGRVERD